MHEPRGVGLMHTRRRPSEDNYTHDAACARKLLARGFRVPLFEIFHLSQARDPESG